MPLPICANRTISGIRRTSSTDTVNIIVEAYHNIADGEVDRVDFAISLDGVAQETPSVSSRGLWTPNDSIYSDPLPGVTGLAPIWGYGLPLSMSDYGNGAIEVVPTVYSAAGDQYTLDPIIVYNDKDGADSRPCTGEIYFDFNNGNDANNGLEADSAVKSFQRALHLLNTSGDVGGGTIYVASTGIHYVQSYSNYGFGTNVKCSGHWWVTVKPADGLPREDTILTTTGSAPGWFTFAGVSSTPSNANIRFENVKIIPEINFSTTSNITPRIWLEHCLTEPPAPYNQDPPGGGLAISAFDYRSEAIGVNFSGPEDRIYATSHTASHHIFPRIGNSVRGAYINRTAGPVIQINRDNNWWTNILVESIHGSNVSGYFGPVTGAFRLEFEEGATYRLQATDNYVSEDVAPYADFLADSQSFGIYLQGFSNGSNNDTHRVISGGYSGIYPYIAITGYSTLVAEGEATVVIRPGLLSDNSSWNTNIHSDIVQFNSDNLENTILSNIAVFSGWSTQGIFGDGHPLSGVAIFNFYDGFVSEDYSIPTRTYFTDDVLQHVIIRNCTFTTVNVDSTQASTDLEWIDCVFTNLTAYAGTTAAYEGIAELNYNHFVNGSDAIGSNVTTGTFFRSDSPSLLSDARPSVESTAYGTASTLWGKPEIWNSTNSKGALNNVALGSWYTTPIISAPNITPLTLSGQILGSPTIVVTPSPLNTSSEMLTGAYSPSPSTFDSPEIEIDPSEVYSVSAIAILDGDLVPNIYITGNDAMASVSVMEGTGVVAVPKGITIGISFPDFTQVITTNVPFDPPRVSPTSRPTYAIGTPTALRALSSTNSIKDDEILPVMQELSKINGNIAKASTNSKSIWSQTILENVSSPFVSRTIISIANANYNTFTQKRSNPAGKVIVNNTTRN